MWNTSDAHWAPRGINFALVDCFFHSVSAQVFYNSALWCRKSSGADVCKQTPLLIKHLRLFYAVLISKQFVCFDSIRSLDYVGFIEFLKELNNICTCLARCQLCLFYCFSKWIAIYQVLYFYAFGWLQRLWKLTLCNCEEQRGRWSGPRKLFCKKNLSTLKAPFAKCNRRVINISKSEK